MACRAGHRISIGTMKEAPTGAVLLLDKLYIVGNQAFLATIPSRVRLLGAALQQCLYEAFPPQTWAALHKQCGSFYVRLPSDSKDVALPFGCLL
jgi:hypothetical protein